MNVLTSPRNFDNPAYGRIFWARQAAWIDSYRVGGPVVVVSQQFLMGFLCPDPADMSVQVGPWDFQIIDYDPETKTYAMEETSRSQLRPRLMRMKQ